MKKITDNIVIDSNGCWLWQKSCSSAGYGQFTRDGVYWNTHRYVWQHFNGDIPKGKHIRHTCHVRACSNPDHLIIGSAKDNYYDSKDTHDLAQSLKRKSWYINGIKYCTSREAVEKTGLSMNSVIKYTDKISRVFDVESYRKACTISNNNPKV